MTDKSPNMRHMRREKKLTLSAPAQLGHSAGNILSEKQQLALQSLRNTIKPDLKTSMEREWCSDSCLVRYLRARDWDQERALTMLRETLKWRRVYKPHLITAEEVRSELQNEGKMYRNGKDKQGRPIIYMRPAKDNTGSKDKDLKVKYLVYLMEKATRSMDESVGVERSIWLIDYRGTSFYQVTAMNNAKLAREVLEIVQNHYPERLGAAYVINAPRIFEIFWKMVSPFLTDVTKSKLNVLKEEDLPILNNLIDPHILEEGFGGKNSFKYNFELHWNKEDLEHPIPIEGEPTN